MLKERKKIINSIIGVLNKSKTFLITGHIRPDGDTIGSELALALWLKKKNKEVEIVNSDPVPCSLSFLKDVAGLPIGRQPSKKSYDTGIILECPDKSRVGDIISGVNFARIINIDHHMETEGSCSGDYNLIATEVSSCSELVYNIMECAGNGLTQQEAMCLYTGILTDTGKFQQSNTTPLCLKIASTLLGHGLDSAFIYKNVYCTKSIGSLRFLGEVLTTLKVSGPVSYLTIPRKTYLKYNAKEEDSEGLINYAGMVPGVKIFALFRQMLNEKNKIKVSLRSYGNINVNSAAKNFGGGGHFHASGFERNGSMEKVLKEVTGYLQKVLK